MRSLKESILSNSKVGKFDEWSTLKRESSHPKDKNELRDIIINARKLKGDNVDLNWIDTSAIDDLSYLFFNSAFNGDISKWDTSNVTSMIGMFEDTEFNGDISKWDVSNVKWMDFMFLESKFNGDLSKWDVRKAEHNMHNMFGASPLEQNPPKWYKK